MVFNVPQFKNNEILSEKQLYALAQLSLEYYRWNCISTKQYGFFTPPQIDNTRRNHSWNQFFFENQTLYLSNLYLISKQGYPLIFEGTKSFEKVGNTLYAVVHFAKDSQSYIGRGYEVSFEWDLPKMDSPVEEQEQFLINLGTVIESEGKRIFSLNPPVIFLDSTSTLWEEALHLKKIVHNYGKQLLKHSRENTVDRSELLHRLDRLILLSENTRMVSFIQDAQLALESARGFYHRLIYQETSQDESWRNLMGRALEEELIQTKGSIVKPEIFDRIGDCLSLCLGDSSNTGQTQLALVKKLGEILSSNSPLFKYLQIEKIVINSNLIPLSEGYPQTFPPRRYLYRYELSKGDNTNCQVVVEFTQNPKNAGFMFSNEEKNPDSLPFLKKNAKLEGEDSRRHRYRLVGKPECYLFIAAPLDAILKVELTKDVLL